MKQDIYERITNQIVAELEKGVRPWMQPWNGWHAAERITRPLRANGIPYQGINVVMLWSEAVARGYAAPIWMTYLQAQELGAHVRGGESAAALWSTPQPFRAPRPTRRAARRSSAISPT